MPSFQPFVFAVCQPGAEAALKQDVARRRPEWRPAFSRPGFVTFRTSSSESTGPLLDSPFARTSGLSLGKATGASSAELARDARAALHARLLPGELETFRHWHVFARERALPGDASADDAAPPVDATAIGAALREALQTSTAPLLNEHALPGDLILDCVVVEPTEWWLGWHRATAIETCWPGGAPNLTPPPGMISRAYLKLQEALLWSGFAVAAGDRCVEIGSAPGGSCQLLLERGCFVVGIDPAEMDATVLAHPRFTHVRARAKDVKRSVFRDCRWLTADANVAPNYTLDTVEAVVMHAGNRIEGLLLTLKLTDAKLVAKLPAFLQRIASWGYARVRARQLAFNRQELCVAASQRSFS